MSLGLLEAFRVTAVPEYGGESAEFFRPLYRMHLSSTDETR